MAFIEPCTQYQSDDGTLRYTPAYPGEVCFGGDSMPIEYVPPCTEYYDTDIDEYLISPPLPGQSCAGEVEDSPSCSHIDKRNFHEDQLASLSKDCYPLDNLGDVDITLGGDKFHDSRPSFPYEVNPEFVRLCCYSIKGFLLSDNLTHYTKEKISDFLVGYLSDTYTEADRYRYSAKLMLDEKCN